MGKGAGRSHGWSSAVSRRLRSLSPYQNSVNLDKPQADGCLDSLEALPLGMTFWNSQESRLVHSETGCMVSFQQSNLDPTLEL